MIKTSYLKLYWKLSSIFSLALLLVIAMSSFVLANEDDDYNFPTGNHEGGGVRGQVTGCEAQASNPVSLAPKDTQALTVSDSPELLFYVPDVTQASTLEILLLDQDNEVVYRDEFAPGDKPGIISVNLVDNSNSDALKINSLYHWYLVQACGGIDTPNIVADGSIQRIKLEPDLANKLENAAQLEKVKLFQSANIWYDAIANLSQLKCNSAVETKATQGLIQLENINDNFKLFSQSLASYCLNNVETE